jgi:hypothetical protein
LPKTGNLFPVDRLADRARPATGHGHHFPPPSACIPPAINPPCRICIARRPNLWQIMMKQQGDDYNEELWDRIREKGEVVASHQWNRRAPGAGAGATYFFCNNGFFYGEDDASDLMVMLSETDATTSLWIDPRFK